MTIKPGFILRSVAGEHVVVAVGSAVSQLNGIIKLNDSGAFLWELLINGAEETQLVDAMLERYSISREIAVQSLTTFLDTLNGVGCLE